MKNSLSTLNRWCIAAGLSAACLGAPLTASAEPNLGDILKEQARRELNKDYDRRYDRERDFNRDYDRERYRERRDWEGRNRDSTDAAVQRALSRRGYYDGPADGSLGPGSRRAISRYQRDNGIPVTGTVTPSLLRALRI